MSKAEERAKERYWLEPNNIETQEKYAAYVEGYNQAEKDLVAKACEYLDLHCDEVKTEDNGIAGWIDNEFITNFRKAMEEQ